MNVFFFFFLRGRGGELELHVKKQKRTHTAKDRACLQHKLQHCILNMGEGMKIDNAKHNESTPNSRILPEYVFYILSYNAATFGVCARHFYLSIAIAFSSVAGSSAFRRVPVITR
jgi:hypothetical protein